MRQFVIVVSLATLCFAASCATGSGTAEDGHSPKRSDVTPASAVVGPNPLAVAKLRASSAGRLSRAMRRRLLRIKGKSAEAKRGATEAKSAETPGKRTVLALFSRLVGGPSVELFPDEEPSDDSAPMGPIAKEEFLWLGLSATTDARIQRVMDYGGVLANFLGTEPGVGIRMLVPTSEPKRLVSNLESYCRGEANGKESDRCPYLIDLDAGAVDGYVLATVWRGIGDEGPISERAVPVHRGFGFDASTHAWTAFAEHGQSGFYTTFEAVRRLGVIIGLSEAARALQHAHPTNKVEFAGRGVSLAMDTLKFAAADAAAYTDLAILYRSNLGGTESRAIDLVSTPVSRKKASSSNQSEEMKLAPMPSAKGSVVRASWSVGRSDLSSFPVHPISKQNKRVDPRSIRQMVRDGGMYRTFAMVSALMESPIPFLLAFSSDSAKSAAQPRSVSVNLGLQTRDGPPGIELTGGLAVAWHKRDAPEWSIDALPSEMAGHRLEYGWKETDTERLLKVSVNDAMNNVFGQPVTPASSRFVSLDVGQLSNVANRDAVRGSIQRSVSRFRTLVDAEHLHTTAVHRPSQRIVRVEWSSGERSRPTGYDTGGDGASPRAERFAVMRCRTRHIDVAVSAMRASGNVTPGNKWKLFSSASSKAASILDDCAEKYPDRRSGFEAARRSWWNWFGEWMWSGFEFAWAKKFWNKSCQKGGEWACERSQLVGNLKGWLHPPVTSVVPRGPGEPKAGRRWAVRLHRDGAGRIIFDGPDNQKPKAKSFDAPGSFSGAFESIRNAINTGRNSSQGREGSVAVMTLVPDALTPSGALKPALEVGTPEQPAQVRVKVTDEFAMPGTSPPLPNRRALVGAHATPAFKESFGRTREESRQLDDLKLRAVVYVTPTGVVIERRGPDDQNSSRLGLRGGVTDISTKVETAESTAKQHEQTSRDRLRRAYEAVGTVYPLRELNQKMVKIGQNIDSESLVEFRVHPRVPIQSLVEVVSASLIRRKGAPFQSFDAYRKAEPATVTRGYHRMFAQTFDGWRIEVTKQRNTDNQENAND